MFWLKFYLSGSSLHTYACGDNAVVFRLYKDTSGVLPTKTSKTRVQRNYVNVSHMAWKQRKEK